MLYFVIIIILAVIIYQKNQYIKELEKQILVLKQKLKKATNLNETAETQEIIKTPTSKTVEDYSTKVSKKTVKTELEQKNTSILIVGSILIVLAAIVFLTTAWNSISDITKTIVLFLFVGIFLGASKIANEKFKLEKASKTFFYIAMAYIPICILSVSIFGLMGNYLSINGDGKYLYLCISTIILAILYYFVSKKTDNIYLIYGSTLSQLLSVILFTLLFEERLFLVFINLLLYNILLMLLTKDKIFKKIYNVIPIIIAVIALFGIFDISVYTILSYILIAINFLILELKESNFMRAFAFNFYLFLFGFSLIWKESFNISAETQQLLLTLYTLIIFFLQNLLLVSLKKNKNLANTCQILSCASMLYTYAFSIFEAAIIPSFLIGFIFIGLLAISYSKSKNVIYKYVAYAFTNILLLDVNNALFDASDLSYFVPALTTLGIIYFEKVYPTLDDEFLPIYLGVSQSIALLSLSALDTEVSIILVIVFAVYIVLYNNKTKKNQLCNIVPLGFVLPSIIDGSLSFELKIGILFLLTGGLTFASLYKGKANIYTIFSGIYLALTCSNFDNDYLSEIFFLAWSYAHVYFLSEKQEKNIFKILTTIFATILYYTVAEDLGILSYTIFAMLGAIVAGLYIIRGVIRSSAEYVDNIEYIFWLLIYAYAFFQYADAVDGIIFSLLVLVLIFFSYSKKYGATFLSAIIALLVNAFALTREFWFSIPWWIYLLAIGGSLIGFAIKNEANENKEKLSVGKILKNIKENCEK